MVPCKRRRAAVTESVQQPDDLDLESAAKSAPGRLKDLGSESPSWGQCQESLGYPEVHSVHDRESQLSMEAPSLSSKTLAQRGNLPVLEDVDVTISQEITLPSVESSHSLTVHLDKGRLQATASRKAKKIVFQPGQVTREDRGDHPVIEEPPLLEGEPGGEVKAEGGKGERSRLLFPCPFRLSLSEVLNSKMLHPLLLEYNHDALSGKSHT